MKMRKRIAGFLALLLLAVTMTVPVQAAELNSSGSEAVNEARNGVLQINLTYIDQNGNSYVLQGGTGFLIGDESGAEYMITNAHVVNLDADVSAAASEMFGVDFSNLNNINLQIQVVVKRDVVINASIVNQSADMDFAILRLEQTIYDRVPLTIDDNEESLVETMEVYALGFPSAIELVEDTPFYVSSDVNIINGIVSTKTSIDGIKYIRHSATMTAGNSGGPLLNSDGNVVGVNTLGIDDTYFYSLEISEVTSVLDALGITYTSADEVQQGGDIGGEQNGTTEDGETVPEVPEPVETVDLTELSALVTEAGAMDLSAYDEESSAALSSAVADGQLVLNKADATQEEVDAAVTAITEAQNNLVEKQGMSMGLIIGIIAAAVVVIVIIIVVIMMSRKRKPAAETAYGGSTTMTGGQGGRPAGSTGTIGGSQSRSTGPAYSGGRNVQGSGMTAGSGSGDTALLNSGSEETSLLGSGETSILGGGAPAVAATLVRKKTGEQIQIRKQLFKVGKERVNVDYCISDNSTISRIHVQITYRGGEYYITDMKSTNYTYVNGNKLAANQEVKLRNGDKIKLSDEEFEFRC